MKSYLHLSHMYSDNSVPSRYSEHTYFSQLVRANLRHVVCAYRIFLKLEYFIKFEYFSKSVATRIAEIIVFSSSVFQRIGMRSWPLTIQFDHVIVELLLADLRLIFASQFTPFSCFASVYIFIYTHNEVPYIFAIQIN